MAAPAFVAGLLVAPAGIAVAAESRDWAYLYLHDGSAPVGEPVTPPLQDSVTGARSTVTHDGTGAYTVRFTDVGVTGTELGVVHVTSAVGNTACQVKGSYALLESTVVPGHYDAVVGVACTRASGGPLDARFYAIWTFADGTPLGGPGAYAEMIADDSTSAGPYTPVRSFTSNGRVPTITKRGTGLWTVRLFGSPFFAGAGSAQVTAFGATADAPARCNATGWDAGEPDAMLVDVECHAAVGGSPVDSNFMFSYQRERTLLGTRGILPYGYARNDLPLPNAYNFPDTVTFPPGGFSGMYEVSIPVPFADPGPFTVQVNVIRPATDICSVTSWTWELGNAHGKVLCRSAGGSSSGTAFSLSFLGT